MCDSSVMPRVPSLQHQRADDHDRREGHRPRPRPARDPQSERYPRAGARRMIRHIVLVRFRPEVPPAEIEAIGDMLRALVGRLDGLRCLPWRPGRQLRGHGPRLSARLRAGLRRQAARSRYHEAPEHKRGAPPRGGGRGRHRRPAGGGFRGADRATLALHIARGFDQGQAGGTQKACIPSRSGRQQPPNVGATAANAGDPGRPLPDGEMQ